MIVKLILLVAQWRNLSDDEIKTLIVVGLDLLALFALAQIVYGWL
jgi:hypothetical protein